MKLKNSVIALLVGGVFVIAGLGLYQLGMWNGMDMSAPKADMGRTGARVTVNPSNWGIPEGEAATRRHIETGLTAGELDPITGQTILHYQDPMMPGKKFEQPGKSPYMDMMLVPVYSSNSERDTSAEDDQGVTISSQVQQNLGLRTVAVEEGSIAPEVSAVGAITWNERDQVNIQARALGYVEKVHVRATLDAVTAGQPLFDLYVPDWVAAQEEFLSIRHMQGTDINALLDAARARMRQAGMDEQHIRRVESTVQLQARLTIVAPISGVVAELAVREGMTVSPGMTLVRINSLDTVWANAEVPESQTALLRPGDQVVAISPAAPGATFAGRVQALLPEVNPATRTRKARMELTNPGGHLVPGMFVEMHFPGNSAQQTLLVPSEALIRTGKRTLVMVAEDGGTYRPAEVTTGIESGGRTQIIAGLQPGEQVVLSGQFLIDSEANLKGIEARLVRAVLPDPDLEADIDTDTHHTQARIEAIRGDLLTLTHADIPSLKWPAMTMDFKLAPELHQPDLAVGQDIEIEFHLQKGDAPQIVKIRNPPQGTATGGDQ